MMKKISAVFVCALTAACMAFGNGCTKGNDSQQTDGSLTYSLYQSYVETAEAAGKTPLSYENWIISIKGDKGDDGEAGKDGLQGDKGDKGDKGDEGKSAYDIWIAAGNSGTVDEFLSYLKGDKGDKGEVGQSGKDGTDGEKGEKGDDGVSVIGAHINSNTHLILELSDGTEIDAGYVGVPAPLEEEATYTVTFVADGITVDTVKYKKGDLSITAPAVPEKTGYTGKWDDYTLSDCDITVNAVYTAVGTEQPDPIKPAEPDGTEIIYHVEVQSVGGLKLNGVKVSAVNSEGQTVATASSSNGQAKLTLVPAEYTITVDASTLPKGYNTDGTVYKTDLEGSTITVKLSSKVISESAPDGLAYSVGVIAYDFTLRDYKGGTHTLSEILKTKRAVVINFWKDSADCTSQLGKMQGALSANAAVEMIGVCRENISDGEIAEFVESNQSLGLTFPIAADKANLIDSYNLSVMPTTVIIDRYGLIAYYSEGANTDLNAFMKLLADMTSDRYIQKIS